jgi:RNA polymerase sigma-70 factor (ECF subfamily)
MNQEVSARAEVARSTDGDHPMSRVCPGRGRGTPRPYKHQKNGFAQFGVLISGSNTVEGRPLEETEVVERARRGDDDAYEELVHRYTEIAFRTACLVTGSAADAEEVAQDAFVKAWSALPRFRAGAPFRPWLLRIVGNEARNRRRAAGRRAAMELRVAEGLRAGGAAPSPEAEAESVEETASVLELPEGTVKSRLHRSMDHLRQLLEPVHG